MARNQTTRHLQMLEDSMHLFYTLNFYLPPSVMFVSKLTLLVTILAFSALISRPAQACTCVMPPAPLVALDQADVVFAGKVVRISQQRGQYGDVYNVIFDVSSYWKGEYGAQIAVQTATNSAACGYRFERGREYLVYGFLSASILRTNICMRTARLEEAQDDLAELGDAEEMLISRSRSRCGGPTNAAAIQTFLFLFAGMLVINRKKMTSLFHRKA